MTDKLSEEEVLHTAELARIEISKEELSSYQIKLKKLLDDVDKIKEIKLPNSDGEKENEKLIAPWSRDCVLRNDEEGVMLDPKEVLQNVPKKSGNYIEVPVVINE